MKPMTFEEFLASDEIGAAVLREKIARDPTCECALLLAYQCGVMVAVNANFDSHMKREMRRLVELAK